MPMKGLWLGGDVTEYALYDDFSDGVYSSRTGSYSYGGVSTNKMPIVPPDLPFPEWTVVAGAPSVVAGELVMPANAVVSIPSTFNVGTWEYKVRKGALGGVAGLDLYTGGVRKYSINLWEGGNCGIYDWVDMTWIITAAVGDSTLQKTIATTRDGASNWEVFFDGASIGTALDATTTTFDEIRLRATVQTIYFDDVRVY